MRMIYSPPPEFTDDDKWFRYFTKKNLYVLVPGLFISAILAKYFVSFGLGIPVFIIVAGITVILTAFTMIPMPGRTYINGGSLTIDVILVRRYIRKKNACLYVRGYGKDNEE